MGALRRRGYASYLLGEAIRILRHRGVATIEAQTMASNEAARAFYTKFGFTEIDQGVVFRKERPASLLPPLGVGAPKVA